MTKIGIDARLPAYRMGGISRYIIRLIEGLGKLDADNDYVIFHHRKDDKTYTPDKANFTHKTVWTPCHHRLEKVALGAEINGSKLDILHSPDFIPPSFGAKKHVITVHDLTFLHYPEFLTAESRRYYNGQIKWAVEKATMISADSEQTRQDLIDLLNVPPEKVQTIYLAADARFSKPVKVNLLESTRKKHNLPTDFLLFVGTFEPRKNIPTLLRIYKRLRDEYGVDLPLVLLGSKGWLSEDLDRLATDLNISQHLVYLTGVDDTQLHHIYKSAAVLLQPSFYEGFGLPPLEAMHAGCPVVVSDKGSLPEIVGENGLILPPDDVDAWAKTVNQLLTDSTFRDTLTRLAKEKAKTFTWQRTATQTLDLYRRTLNT